MVHLRRMVVENKMIENEDARKLIDMVDSLTELAKEPVLTGY